MRGAGQSFSSAPIVSVKLKLLGAGGGMGHREKNKEIIRQMEAAKEIENEISNQFIRIGMFQVNTLDIRNVLANKHRNIAERLRSDLALKVLHQSKKHDILFKKMSILYR